MTQLRMKMAVEVIVPFMTVDAVKGALVVDEDEVLELISAGELRWAFDLRTAKAKRAEVRIFAPCVQEAQLRAQGVAITDYAGSIDEVIDWVFPHKRPVLRATEIDERWNMSSTHIHNLIREGSLQAVAGTGDGVNQTPLVKRESAIAFLKGRQL